VGDRLRDPDDFDSQLVLYLPSTAKSRIVLILVAKSVKRALRSTAILAVARNAFWQSFAFWHTSHVRSANSELTVHTHQMQISRRGRRATVPAMTNAAAKTDPTLDFLAQFDDPSRWVVVNDAPICRPHRRSVRRPDGGEDVVEVTVADLARIASEMQWRERESGVVPVMTIGHRQQNDPAFPETEQPPVVGFARNARVGTFGPRNIPCVVGTLYYKREWWPEAKEYPFRSMDFFPPTMAVTGVALLKRDPFLQLGMVTYEQGDGMNEKPAAKRPDDEDEHDRDAQAHDQGGESGDDKPLTLKYLKKHPAWQYMCQQYEASRIAAQGPPADDAKQAPPEMPKPGDRDQSDDQDEPEKFEAETMQARRGPLTYQARLAALEGRVQSLERGNTDLAAKLARKESEFLVYQLQLEGMKALAQPESASKLVDRLATMPPAQRYAYVSEIRSCWERDANLSYAMLGAPVGAMVPVSQAPSELGSRSAISERQLDVALRYLRDNSCSWNEAEQYARNNHR
jgi:hypothetical protein